MRILIVFTFICLSIDSISQSFSGTIEDSKIARLSDGILVYGFSGSGKATELVVYKYGNSLQKVAEYKKAFLGEVSTNAHECFIHHDSPIFIFRKGAVSNEGEVIKLDGNLKELVHESFTKDEYKQGFGNSTSYFLYNEIWYINNAKPKYHINYDLITVNPTGIRRLKYIENVKFPEFKKEPIVRCDSNRKVYQSYPLFADENIAIGYQSIMSDKQPLIQQIICADLNKGRMLFDIQLNETGKSIYVPSSAYFDPITKQVYLAGGYSDITNKKFKKVHTSSADPSDTETFKVRHDGVFVAVIDLNGKIKSLQTKPYNFAFTHFKDADRDVLCRFHFLKPGKNGRLVAVAEIIAEKGRIKSYYGEMIYTFSPFGYLSFEITADGIIEGYSATEFAQNDHNVLKNFQADFNSFFLYPDPERMNNWSVPTAYKVFQPKVEYHAETEQLLILHPSHDQSGFSEEPYFYYKKTNGISGGTFNIVPGIGESKTFIRCIAITANSIAQFTSSKSGFTLKLVKI